MPGTHRLADVGFHAGELAVQQRAGVRAEAARLTPMLEPATLTGGITGFLAGRTFLVITGRDAAGRLWASPLSGAPGFMEVVSEAALAIHAAIPPGDPLNGLAAGQKIGLITVEFAARRRVRINGTLTVAEDDLLIVEAEQAFGNCPQYIQQRLLESSHPGQAGPGDVRRDDTLSADDAELIRGADTFFLGTTHPGRGTDASHRGGPAGFVRVDGNQLWWPDYPGNNLFNSFGNLAVASEAALLFPDFTTGRTVQLSGTAEVEWDHAGEPGDDGRTGRRAVFTVQRVVAGQLLAARQVAHHPYSRNPARTD
jgi:predicted pyridoxine 5'-phosphate oxidase superfamily flavin-nucleotide-binding protein